MVRVLVVSYRFQYLLVILPFSYICSISSTGTLDIHSSPLLLCSGSQVRECAISKAKEVICLLCIPGKPPSLNFFRGCNADLVDIDNKC